MKTEIFWSFWWFTVAFCASSILNIPMYLIGFLLLGKAAFKTDDTNKIMLMAGLCALQYIAVSVGFAFAERFAYRQKNSGMLVITSIITFPVGFISGMWNALLFDIPSMESLAMYRWFQNIAFISVFLFLPLTGAVGLVSAGHLRRKIRNSNPSASN